MSVRFLWVSVFSGALFVGGVQAGEGHDPQQHDSHESHSHSDLHPHQPHHIERVTQAAHIHGEIILQLALQGNDLLMQLESPAINMVGFEHRARTPDQIKIVEAAETKLRQVANWLMFDGGECRATGVNINASGVMPTADTSEYQHGHADIKVDAQFTCFQPNNLRGLKVTLFRDFPGAEKITVQWLLGGKVGERSLSSENARLTFTD